MSELDEYEIVEEEEEEEEEDDDEEEEEEEELRERDREEERGREEDEDSQQSQIATQAAAAMAAAMAAQQLLASAAAIYGLDWSALNNFALLASAGMGNPNAAGAATGSVPAVSQLGASSSPAGVSQALAASLAAAASAASANQQQTPEQLMATAMATAAFLSQQQAPLVSHAHHHHHLVPEDLTIKAQQQQQQQQQQQLLQPQQPQQPQPQLRQHHLHHHHHHQQLQQQQQQQQTNQKQPVHQVQLPGQVQQQQQQQQEQIIARQHASSRNLFVNSHHLGSHSIQAQQHQHESSRHHTHSRHLLGGHHHHSSIQTQQQLLATNGFNPMAVLVGSGQQTEILTPTHLRKAKLMFFYVRYPNSSILKECFRDVRFNKNNTAQLIKWFSNFREFYYIQMEKFARDAVADDRIQCKDDIVVSYNHELINQLNNHYNKNRHIELPEVFRQVVEETLRHFFDAIHNKRDQEQSWKKAIYRIINRLDQEVPEVFKTDAFNEHLE